MIAADSQLWFMSILAGVTLASIVLCFHESYGPYIQRRIVATQDGLEDKSLRPSTRQVIVQAFTRPARMSRNPLLVVFALYYAWLYGCAWTLETFLTCAGSSVRGRCVRSD